MEIPTTTNVTPIRAAGYVYSPMQDVFNNPFIGFDEVFSGVISNLSYDYMYEKYYEAGTHNLDPTSLAPEAFYLFEELIDGNVVGRPLKGRFTVGLPVFLKSALTSVELPPPPP